MDCARSESIFCCPRAVLFFLREPDVFPFVEAVWDDDFFVAEEGDTCVLWGVALVAVLEGVTDFCASACIAAA